MTNDIGYFPSTDGDGNNASPDYPLYTLHQTQHSLHKKKTASSSSPNRHDHSNHAVAAADDTDDTAGNNASPSVRGEGEVEPASAADSGHHHHDEHYHTQFMTGGPPPSPPPPPPPPLQEATTATGATAGEGNSSPSPSPSPVNVSHGYTSAMVAAVADDVTDVEVAGVSNDPAVATAAAAAAAAGVGADACGIACACTGCEAATGTVLNEFNLSEEELMLFSSSWMAHGMSSKLDDDLMHVTGTTTVDAAAADAPPALPAYEPGPSKTTSNQHKATHHSVHPIELRHSSMSHQYKFDTVNEAVNQEFNTVNDQLKSSLNIHNMRDDNQQFMQQQNHQQHQYQLAQQDHYSNPHAPPSHRHLQQQVQQQQQQQQNMPRYKNIMPMPPGQQHEVSYRHHPHAMFNTNNNTKNNHPQQQQQQQQNTAMPGGWSFHYTESVGDGQEHMMGEGRGHHRKDGQGRTMVGQSPSVFTFNYGDDGATMSDVHHHHHSHSNSSKKSMLVKGSGMSGIGGKSGGKSSSSQPFLPLQIMPRLPTVPNFRQHNIDPIRKQPGVPHSNVEKQRRDRMNSLVDELRLLVPVAEGGMETSENKRPKHVVLSDTVDYLRAVLFDNSELRERVRVLENETKEMTIREREMSDAAQMSLASIDEEDRVGMRGGGGSGVPHGGGGGADGLCNRCQPGHECATCVQPSASGHQQQLQGKSLGRDSTRPSTTDLMSEMTSTDLMSNEDSSMPTVEIYAEDGKTIFRLCCQDRRGLLGDVANALQRMPLHVKSANIVTSVDHWVCDKFEVELDANAPSFSDLKFNFLEVFKDVAREASIAGEKRRRG